MVVAIGTRRTVWHYLEEAATNELCIRACPSIPNPAAVIAYERSSDHRER